MTPENERNPDENPQASCFFSQLNVEFLIHELKDPLSVVETNARVLIEQAAKDGAAQRQINSLQRILRSTLKARAMLWDLLEVGRAEAACFDCRAFRPDIVLKQILMEMVETHAPDFFAKIMDLQGIEERLAYLAHQGIRLDIHPAAAEIQMTQDETKFRQICANLIKNALFYRRRLVLIQLASLRDFVTLSVRDDGPGIEHTHHELIFQRYRQVHANAGVARSGHGLGLAAARILARTMGGDIQLESQLGQGALFHLNMHIDFANKALAR